MAKRSQKAQLRKRKTSRQGRKPQRVANDGRGDVGRRTIVVTEKLIAKAPRKLTPKSKGTRKQPKIRSLANPKISPRKTTRKIAKRSRVVRRKRPQRAMTLFSEGKTIRAKVGRKTAGRIGEYLNAVDEFLKTNDPHHLGRFVGLAVKDNGGKSHILETRPNALYRLNASIEPFEEVYRILT